MSDAVTRTPSDRVHFPNGPAYLIDEGRRHLLHTVVFMSVYTNQGKQFSLVLRLKGRFATWNHVATAELFHRFASSDLRAIFEDEMLRQALHVGSLRVPPVALIAPL